MDVTTTSEPRSTPVGMDNDVIESRLAPGEILPLVVTPRAPGLPLVAWARAHRDAIRAKLLVHGAVLFRDFGIASIPEFEAFAGSLVEDELFGEYNDLPHEQGKIYGTTPYPPDKAILFHNESSHMHRWNAHQFFYCIQPSQRHGTTAEWKKGGGLRLKQRAPGVITHPVTGEKLFFNQVQLHHVSCVDPKVRRSLQMLFKPEDLPRNVYYGDGTPIPDATMAEIDRVYWQIAKQFDWKPRDVIAIDNMLVSHARLPYTGPRKIVVAMGDLLDQKDFFAP